MSSPSLTPNSERKRSVRFNFDRNQSDLPQRQPPAGGRTDEYSNGIPLRASLLEAHNNPQIATYRDSTSFASRGSSNSYTTNRMDAGRHEDSMPAQSAHYPQFERPQPFGSGEVSPRSIPPSVASPSDHDPATVRPGIYSFNSMVDGSTHASSPHQSRAGSIGSWHSYTVGSPSPAPTIPEKTYGSYYRSSDDWSDARKGGEADMVPAVRSPEIPQVFSPPAPTLAYNGVPGPSQLQITPPSLNEPNPPALRSALRNAQAQVNLGRGEAINRVNTAGLEEGDSTRVRSGVFTNLLKLYGMSGNGLHHRRTGRSQSQHSMASSTSRGRDESCDSTFFPTARNYGGDQTPSRCTSTQSVGNMELLDSDDPRITGIRTNTIDQEKHAKDTIEPEAKFDKRRKRQASIKYHISCKSFFVFRLDYPC